MKAGALVVACAIAVGAAGTAAAGPDPKRKVVVLEFRAGSAALPRIADRIGARLRNLTSLDVIALDVARQRLADLDETVVRCSGEAACLAGIGAKVGADEVVLVGVSELGDVILTLQRITVKKRQVEARLAESLAAADEPTDALLAQYLGRLLPPSDFVRYGMIDIVANLTGARVKLGREDKGTTPIPPLKVRAPASYDIRVEKSGYVPFSASVAVPPDGEVTVKAELTKRGGGDRWYQKWWVLAIAGGAVVAATGTAIYVGSRDDDGVRVDGVLD
jgi:hypothetical protein